MAEQSKGWDEAVKLPETDGKFHSGCWPANEGLPGHPWRNSTDKPLFEVVTVWGLRTDAKIDDTTQYTNDGVKWAILEEGRYRSIPTQQIAGWLRK
jgi:hypothetical protein